MVEKKVSSQKRATKTEKKSSAKTTKKTEAKHKTEHKKKKEFEYKDVYLSEFEQAIEKLECLTFLKKKVEELKVKFELSQLTACYRLAMETLKDVLEKKNEEIKNLQVEHERFKLKNKLLLEELMVPSSEREKLKTDLKLQEKALQDSEERYQRLKADFDNYRRRMDSRIEELTRMANEKLIIELLPVLDNFERAMNYSSEFSDVQALFEGVALIKKQLEDLLKKEGLQVIETSGKLFNPAEHEALMRVEIDNCQDDMVVEEVRKGYRLRTKVIRPSLVKVAKSVKLDNKNKNDGE